MMKFSVVIPTRNRAFFLEKAIRSILNQTYSNFEIIISDNNSTDNTYELVKSFGDQRIIYYQTGKTLTIPDNWSFAVSKINGDFFICIGDDDVLHRDTLRKVHLMIQEDANIDFVAFSLWCFHYGANQESGYLVPASKKSFFSSNYDDYVEINKKIYLNDHFQFQKRCIFTVAVMATFIAKKLYDRIIETRGRFFYGPFPDFYANALCVALANKPVQSNFVSTILGRTNISLGLRQVAMDETAYSDIKEVVADMPGNTYYNCFFNTLVLLKNNNPDLFSKFRIDYYRYVKLNISTYFNYLFSLNRAEAFQFFLSLIKDWKFNKSILCAIPFIIPYFAYKLLKYKVLSREYFFQETLNIKHGIFLQNIYEAEKYLNSEYYRVNS